VIATTARRRAAIAAWLCASLLTMATLGWTPAVLAAGPAQVLDVELETETLPAGSTVWLTARVYDASGDLAIGLENDTHIRFYFTSSSPNDPDKPGSDPDMECDTGAAGECSVWYLAEGEGTDTICVRWSGSPGCGSELPGDPERDDDVDAVVRIIGGSPTPTPEPTPSPTPDPTPSPTPDPTPSPTPDPTPSPTPSPTPDPTPSPTPDPTPSPTPTPDPTPSPTPDPTPSPTPDPTPTPTPDPTPTPEPTPSPTPDPTPTPEPTPDPSPTPSDPPASAAAPDPSPSIEATLPPAIDLTDGSPIGHQEPDDFRPQQEVAPITAVNTPAHAAAPTVPVAPAIVAPGANGGPLGFVQSVVASAAGQVGMVVKPSAAAAVAVTFGFPLLLMLAVVAFVVGQARVDHRDPKLRAAPHAVAETVLPFEEETGL
jgi:hypothetical protein